MLYEVITKRNISPIPVGKYEVVNEDNVPLDKDGDALYLADGSVNDDFDRDPSSGLPMLVKLDAYVITSYSIHYTKLYDVGPDMPLLEFPGRS